MTRSTLSELAEHFVGVAVEPSFAGFGGRDHRVVRRPCVRACMSIGRGVTTECDAARLTRTQLNPSCAGLYAFVTNESAGLFDLEDRDEVHTQVWHSGQRIMRS